MRDSSSIVVALRMRMHALSPRLDSPAGRSSLPAASGWGQRRCCHLTRSPTSRPGDRLRQRTRGSTMVAVMTRKVVSMHKEGGHDGRRSQQKITRRTRQLGRLTWVQRPVAVAPLKHPARDGAEVWDGGPVGAARRGQEVEHALVRPAPTTSRQNKGGRKDSQQMSK